MDLWKYYGGDLKYPNVIKYSHEKEIAKTNSKWAIVYAKKYGRNEDLEHVIAKSAKYSYQYAKEILKDSFKLGEPAIATNPEYSYLYALHVLKGPFKLGEKTISNYVDLSYEYARYVLKGKPFLLGEPEIAKDKQFMKQYTQDILKKDFYLDGKLICKYEG